MSQLLLLSLALSTWAWLSKTWLAGLLLLLLVVTAKVSRWRWQISLTQFYRWGDLISVVVVMLLLYLYMMQTQQQPVFVLLKWLPAVFAPILLVQLFSTQQKLPLGTVFYSFRNREMIDSRTLDFQLPYTALTVLSAGAANVKDLSYFSVVAVMVSAILWVNKPRHTALWLWLIVMIIAVGLSYQGQRGLRQLQNIIEYQAVNWFGNWAADPFNSQTSLGDLGEMKLYDAIEFRVKADEPLYLLQSSYDIYLGKIWTVSNHEFSDDNFEQNLSQQPLHRLKIVQQFKQREAVLSLPDGTVEITGLEGTFFEYHPLGAVKIINTPELGEFEVFYNGKRTVQPSKYDLTIPKQHQDWLTSLSQQLKLAEQTPQAAAETIKHYFYRNFRYSLYLGKTEQDASVALREFMLQRKAGHCEYFAIAATLLLRQAGIPARLANGYVMEEYDPDLDLFIVRRRHAHAWAIAYMNGVWQIVDATPSQWLEMEKNNASFWLPVSDWFSQQLLNFKQWRLKQTEQQQTLWLGAAGLMLCYIGLRIYSARRQLTRQHKHKALAIEAINYPGLDSEFYLIAQHLQNTEQEREKHETIQAWMNRLQQPELLQLYRIHYQLRFDPNGINAPTRQQFQQQVQNWLNRQKGN